MEFVELFPTVISKIDLSSEFDFKEIEQYLTDAPMKGHGLLLNGGQSSHDVVEVLDVEYFAPLKARIQELIYDYSRAIGILPTVIGSSWHNVMPEDGILLPHRHEISVITGALYVNAEEGSSSLSFESPTECLRMCEQDIEMTRYSIRRDYVEPKTGLLVLFPSWLKHGSIGNKNENRMIISFNTEVERIR
jgi:uncharacterized protein (TIGR02466 family)